MQGKLDLLFIGKKWKCVNFCFLLAENSFKNPPKDVYQFRFFGGAG